MRAQGLVRINDSAGANDTRRPGKGFEDSWRHVARRVGCDADDQGVSRSHSTMRDSGRCGGARGSRRRHLGGQANMAKDPADRP